MSEKRKMKTLHSKKGKVWTEGRYTADLRGFRFPGTPISAPEDADDFDSDLKNTFSTLVKLLNSGQEPKAESYATSEDIQEINRKLRILGRKLDKNVLSQRSSDVNAAVSYLVSQIADLEGVKKVSYRYEEKNLDFFLSVDRFSSDVLESISEIEIEISRRFPDLSVEMKPIPCDGETIAGSHVLVVKG